MLAAAPHPRVTILAVQTKKRLAGFARDVAAGLTAVPKHLSCRYFYDRRGSALFEQICRLPEYYLTRAEEEILRRHGGEIAALFDSPVNLIELGSGSSAKTRFLIEAFLARQTEQRYIAVDICRPALEEAAFDLAHDYPTLTVLAIAGEYRQALSRLRGTEFQSVLSAPRPPRLILWLGSNIGNFDRAAAARFLRNLRETFQPGDRLLVGIDLRKDPAILEAAYDDASGVTAAFNRNLLVRVNRKLGGHFEPGSFRHQAIYDRDAGRVAMYLVSEAAQTVAIDRLRLSVSFAADEAIHTEDSFKYSLPEIERLAARAGLRRERTWLDAAERFSLNLFAPLRGCP